jgi:hypothetical protein
MEHTRLPLSHRWHLSICSTVARWFLCQFGRNRCLVTASGRRNSFRHVASFLWCPNNSKSLGPMLQPVLWLVMVLRLVAYEASYLHSTSRAVIYSCVDPLRSALLSRYLYQTSTWSNLSPHGCRQLTSIFLLRDTVFCATVGHVLQVKYQRLTCQ